MHIKSIVVWTKLLVILFVDNFVFSSCFQCEHNKECVTRNVTDNWDYYLVDSNGWIIVSEDSTQTGQFFGKVS